MRAQRWLPWLAAMLVVAVYLPALSASFQFDDWQVVLGDPRVASLAAWWQSMPGMRALVKLSYALDHSLGGQVESFRASSIALHAFNTALVFVLVRDLARRLRTADAADAGVVAAVSALVFALHPVQTESVTYIAARPNLVAAFFCLLSLLAWLEGRRRLPWLWWPLSALAYVAALAGKETAAVLPLAMLLCLAAERNVTRRDLVFPAALVGLFLALLAALWPLMPYDYLLRTSLGTRGPLQNLLTQAEGVTWLTGQLLRWDLLNADPMLAPATSATPAVLLRAGMLLAALLALVLATGTWMRNRVYQTEASFWQDVTAKSPHNARAWNNLGMALAAECQLHAAADAFRQASLRDPENPLPEVNLALLELGELDAAMHCPGQRPR